MGKYGHLDRVNAIEIFVLSFSKLFLNYELTNNLNDTQLKMPTR